MQNLSRGCYLSYDPNLYFNPDAPIFYQLLPKKEVKYEKQQSRNPYYVTDDDKIIDRLVKQHQHEFTEGNRNNAVFILACELNRFGITEATAVGIMYRYVESGFPESEMRRTVQSAYERFGHEFKSKSFYDSTIVNKVENLLRHQFTAEQILDKVGKEDKISAETINEALREAQEKINSSLIWKKAKNGQISIDNDILNDWYQKNMIFRYMINEKDWIIIKNDKNHISEISVAHIKGLLALYMKDNANDCDHHMKAQIMRKLNKEYLRDDMFEWLKPTHIDWLRDKRDVAYFFYQNTWIKIDKESISCVEENHNLHGFIWQDQIIERDFQLIGNPDDFQESEFCRFIWNITTGISMQKYLTLDDDVQKPIMNRFWHMCRI